MHLHLIERKDARASGLKRYFTGKPCQRGGISQRMSSSNDCLCLECITHKNIGKMAHYEANKDRILAEMRQRTVDNPGHVNAIAARSYQRNKEKRAVARHAKYHEDIEKSRELGRENAKKQAEWKKQYQQDNPEKSAEYARRQRAKNPEQYRERDRLFRLNNPGICGAIDARGRAARRERLAPWYGEFDHFVMREAASLARLREVATGFAWHVDHMIPMLAKKASGLHCGHNLQVIPAYMNLRKNNKMLLCKPDEWILEL